MHFSLHDNRGGMHQLLWRVDTVLRKFVDEMRAQGAWDSVVVQTLSDFGRTLVYNGRGTDHAWGGNVLTFGGKVRGGRMHGRYPSLDLTRSPLVVDPRRGSLIPTTPWEGIWRPLAQWFGVEEARWAEVMPNLANFPSSVLPTRDDFFHPDTP